MKYFDFHDTTLSQIALGCDHFGASIPEDVARSLLDTYVEMGGTLLDTAAMYGQQVTDGPSSSELVIGRWLAERGVADALTLVSKGCFPDTKTGAGRLNERAMLSWMYTVP